jgi:hypothetical protein
MSGPGGPVSGLGRSGRDVAQPSLGNVSAVRGAPHSIPEPRLTRPTKHRLGGEAHEPGLGALATHTQSRGMVLVSWLSTS